MKIERYQPYRVAVEAVQFVDKDAKNLFEEIAAWAGASGMSYTWWDRGFYLTINRSTHKILIGDWVLKKLNGEVLILPDSAFKALFNSHHGTGSRLREIYEEEV